MTRPPADIVAAAQASAKAWGIPASITLAQWALESAWGAKCSGAFNYFGIKGGPGRPSVSVLTHEEINGRRIEVHQLFRTFASPAEAFEAHAKLLATDPDYAAFRMAIRAKEPLATIVAHLGGGTPAHPAYATDSNYGSKLMAVIRGSNLTEFDA